MSPEEWSHKSVLLKEATGLLVTDESGIYVDATAGMGGHSAAILDKLAPEGRLIALDWDPEMAALARKNLAGYGERARVIEGNFADISGILTREGITSVSGVLFDLGVSSLHFDKPSRGFSLRHDGPLDMRINPLNSLTAETILNKWPLEQIDHLLRVCGEEKNAARIGRAVVERRQKQFFKTTKELADLVQGLFPGGMPGREKIHPATRTFMALRAAVNCEFDNLMRGIEKASSLLKSGGRMAVISFHSLEDRIVKQTFRSMVTVGGWKAVTPKAVKPSEAETAENARARSAKLRVIERI